jgi:molybdopterin synthase sulfur carrier subunit
LVKVEFLGPIGLEDMQIEAATLAELGVKLQEKEELKPWLANSAIAVNDTLVNDKNMTLKEGDKVSILPPVCGG